MDVQNDDVAIVDHPWFHEIWNEVILFFSLCKFNDKRLVWSSGGAEHVGVQIRSETFEIFAEFLTVLSGWAR